MVTEDHWTPSSDWCPHPERWTANSNPDVTEFEVIGLATAFIRALQPDVVVETGTSTGIMAQYLANALLQNGQGHLWTVEIDPALAEHARDLLKPLPATVITGDSLSWEPPDNIEFAWIDSGNATHRVTEVRHWSSLGKFRRGAIVGVHDTAPNHGREPLRLALDQLCREQGWQPMTLRTPRGVTFLQVV